MDAVADIKSRLPIEELVSSYCQLQKKGRNFVCLCPFHKDTHPSFLVSPDKGIAYCFACQNGGDIFSFYQAIEGVDFRQALKDLGERTGVKVEEHAAPAVKADEKTRLKDCLIAAAQYYGDELRSSVSSMQYLTDRKVSQEQIGKFQLGFAPDSFSQTYEHLLKRGFSRKEILAAGLGVQKDLNEERIYDRFRNRLMFPIQDHQGAIVAFGGRTLGEDDAKYINSSEGVLYHKSQVLFGMHHAKEAIRTKRSVIVVEGYFDLLACHAVGAAHVVATSGTALTEQHAKMLKRYADAISLCFDADRAGQDAAERAFHLLSSEGLLVRSIVLPRKDASELLAEDPALLRSTLESGGIPYLDRALEQLRGLDLSDPGVKREALRRILSLLAALPFAVERQEYLGKAAALFQATAATLEEDLHRLPVQKIVPASQASEPVRKKDQQSFSKAEIALVLFYFYPKLRNPLLQEFIAPEVGFAAVFHRALKDMGEVQESTIELLALPDEHREHAAILVLYGEEHGFKEWSESMAIREIRRNCISANRELIHAKQEELTRKLLAARAVHDATEEALLLNQYQQLLKLRKMAG